METRHDLHADVPGGIGNYPNDFRYPFFLAEIHHLFDEGGAGQIHGREIGQVGEESKARLQLGQRGGRLLLAFPRFARGDVPGISYEEEGSLGLRFNCNHGRFFDSFHFLSKHFRRVIFRADH